jgi:farnesyl diphosphate synthase
MSDEPFFTMLKDNAAAVEGRLSDLLSTAVRPGEIARPERLLAAMRHGVLNGGKRMRPALVLESARLFDGNQEAALQVAAALECVHCYSLVHDDLPAMDNDDLRRGQPTVHKAFDDATAILAGDSLLTYAFEILAATEVAIEPMVRAALILELARGAGLGGMAGGQALDLAAEREAPSEDGIVTLQAMKTGALIRFACEAGAIVAGAQNVDRMLMRRFGEIIGLAFQLRDDLLDMTGDSVVLGKAANKDQARGKGTLPALRGTAWTESRLRDLVVEAHELLSPFGGKADMLMKLATYVATRDK